ncbi:MAG: putative transcriptional regulator [halophilic archaeon J07HX64]|jgi:Predicted transcriptional regulator|nr:MAG: putative transcriptional regulator [halophilic archaeon J07HX64]
MESALSELEFLARSENRVAVLQLLATDSWTRGELGEATDASQATLGRILDDFEARSWVRREAEGYVATTTGQLLAEGLADLLDTVETEHKLRDIVPYLPTAVPGFELTQFADATITVPTQTKPTAPLQRVLERMRGAETLRAVSHTLNNRSLAVIADQVTAGRQSFEGVFAEEAIETLAVDEESWAALTELAASDAAQLWIRSDDVPLAATVSDGAVTFLLRDDDGLVQAAVETERSAVREWVTDTVDRYRERATPFSPGSYATD